MRCSTVWGLLLALLLTAASATAAGLRSGDPAPLFSLPDLAGRQLSVPEGTRGKVAIIHFWSSSCTFCRSEIADLQAVYGKTKGVLPVSVNTGDFKSSIELYLAGLKPTYPILVDSGGKVTRSWGVTGIPTTFIVSRSGIIRYKIVGEINAKGITKLLATVTD